MLFNTPHPREWVKVWHDGAKDYVVLVGNTCRYCDEKVDVLDPKEYALARKDGDSFNGWEAHHYLCEIRFDEYGPQNTNELFINALNNLAEKTLEEKAFAKNTEEL